MAGEVLCLRVVAVDVGIHAVLLDNEHRLAQLQHAVQHIRAHGLEAMPLPAQGAHCRVPDI